jgi:hypothetical protein
MPLAMIELNSEGTLLCPNCEGEYLHQLSAQVYFVDAEDSDKGNAFEISKSCVRSVSMRHNPSARRDGIRIIFHCECCSASPSLTVVQHKGQTIMSWESNG